MALKILSWNVEHFRGGDRTKAVAEHVLKHKPDVFALYEVENLGVLELMRSYFPKYVFHITDGPEAQEILVGFKQNASYQPTFVQKREFKAYNPSLRPGASLTLRKGNAYINLLFLHTDSGTDAPAFGNRAEMFAYVWKMKKAIDKLGEEGQFVVTGDLNTMGLTFPRPAKKNLVVAAEREIAALGEAAASANMTLLSKEHGATFNNGTLESDLDHVLVSQGLAVKAQGKRPDGSAYQVGVRGWQQLSGPARAEFIAKVSDHCALVFEVDF
ncbi:endonuclease/exonuclease/phosphatase family protein [Ferribacterium limneticum]|uniref:endonuclease/exonuclease/phosphatase family protein n=1 Tax=Ferribacterium limneticum TaxID=76259 RepID=UPI001CF838C9|nr:endonuclease/exonuclease/phosphatase family protein [Ferribacterium limneticum]UCV26825.1 endonuclease/exonuclease/phosphatase family protein [Ferribacterium limneticum]UCV30742.1 endonuclease/exonuclease/phosphatase family protein [Ferribacterium limneticum]